MFRLSAWILSALLIAGVSINTLAQEPTKEQADRIEQFSQRFENLKKSLNLTSTQEKEVKPILEESMKQRQEILKSYGFEQDFEHSRMSL